MAGPIQPTISRAPSRRIDSTVRVTMSSSQSAPAGVRPGDHPGLGVGQEHGTQSATRIISAEPPGRC